MATHHNDPTSWKPTRYPGLGYCNPFPGLWRFTDTKTGQHVGPQYASKAELLADLTDYAERSGWCPATQAAKATFIHTGPIRLANEPAPAPGTPIYAVTIERDGDATGYGPLTGPTIRALILSELDDPGFRKRIDDGSVYRFTVETFQG